jgi:hypothetical protein
VTEEGWLVCSDPAVMQAFLSRSPDERRMRLFLARCCRRIWHLITDGRSRAAVESAERFALGEVNSAELFQAWRLARVAVCEAKHDEWVAEAQADFQVTAEYCAYSVRLYASCAAMAAVSQKASDAHGGWESYQEPDLTDPPRWLDPPRGSHYWAAAAVGELRQRQVLGSGAMDDSCPIVLIEPIELVEEVLQEDQPTWSSYLLQKNARAAKEACRAAEAAKQANLLRELFGNPFSGDGNDK